MPQPAVFFDLGNVLVRLDLERGLGRLRRLAPRAPASAAAAEVFFAEPALAFNRGELTPEQFLAELARLTGADLAPPDVLAAAWCDIFEPWPEMEALAADVLAAGHPAYLLSNTDPLHFAYLTARTPVLRRLTGLHLSYEVGVMKPDPEYFQRALSRFALDASGCVFIDDRPEHVAAAGQVGICALLHEGDVGAVRAWLRARGVGV